MIEPKARNGACGQDGSPAQCDAMTLAQQLLAATFVVATTVVVHLIGLALLLAVLSRYRRASRRLLVIVHNAAAILVAAFGLFALHSIEIWIWAGVYQWLAAFADFEHAIYFSTSTYVTIGYGDVVLPPGMRILGSIEGASGIILIGWSTAFFFSIVDRMKLLERQLESDHARPPADLSDATQSEKAERRSAEPEKG